MRSSVFARRLLIQSMDSSHKPHRRGYMLAFQRQHLNGIYVCTKTVTRDHSKVSPLIPNPTSAPSKIEVHESLEYVGRPTVGDQPFVVYPARSESSLSHERERDPHASSIIHHLPAITIGLPALSTSKTGRRKINLQYRLLIRA